MKKDVLKLALICVDILITLTAIVGLIWFFLSRIEVIILLYIKQHRQKAGISVPRMCELTGIPRRTIQDLEKRGDCLVSNALKIANVLGVKLDDLLSPPTD